MLESTFKMESTNPSVAILYDAKATHTNTVYEHIMTLGTALSKNTAFIPCSNTNLGLIYSYDILIIHYSVRLAKPRTLPSKFFKRLANFTGNLIVFAQDEYESTATLIKSIICLKAKVLFTCVPEEYHSQIYPELLDAEVRLITVLTGFAPEPEECLENKPYSERAIDIGYRGRTLDFQYGVLGQNKLKIGEIVSNYKFRKDFSFDISSAETSRIYGEAWNKFLQNCKSVLATESGSDIFDFDGNLEKLAYKGQNLSYQEFDNLYLSKIEKFPKMGQISPRIFESIAARNLLILFPGHYSGVIQDGLHYVTLNFDGSNLPEILELLKDSNFYEDLTQRAFEDVIQSHKFCIHAFRSLIANVVNSLEIDSNPKYSKPSLNYSYLNSPITIRYHNLSSHTLIRKIWHLIPKEMRFSLFEKLSNIFESLYYTRLKLYRWFRIIFVSLLCREKDDSKHETCL